MEKLDLGRVLQSIDNEEIVVEVNGKRSRMPRAEAYFRRLFSEAINGDLATAKLIADMAAYYFGPDAEGPAEAKFVVHERYQRSDQTVAQGKENPGNQNPAESTLVKQGRPKKSGTQPQQAPQQVSLASMFRKVARAQVRVKVGGRRGKMSCWDVYLRCIYEMALENNNSATRLLNRLRRQFPGDLLPGATNIFFTWPEDANL